MPFGKWRRGTLICCALYYLRDSLCPIHQASHHHLRQLKTIWVCDMWGERLQRRWAEMLDSNHPLSFYWLNWNSHKCVPVSLRHLDGPALPRNPTFYCNPSIDLWTPLSQGLLGLSSLIDALDVGWSLFGAKWIQLAPNHHSCNLASNHIGIASLWSLRRHIRALTHSLQHQGSISANSMSWSTARRPKYSGQGLSDSCSMTRNDSWKARNRTVHCRDPRSNLWTQLRSHRAT